MMTTKIWICICLLLGYVYISDAVLCYQCSDSSVDEEISDCYLGYWKLRNQRSLYEIDGVGLKGLYSIKNCTGPEGYCKLETIESYGLYNAFIRDCSDGKSFSINATRLETLLVDNQTTCDFSPVHESTICVTLCDEDFCNGPLIDTGSFVTASLAIVVFVSLLLLMFG